MLAEPKYRQKYSVNPRGLDWSKDENKFGQKLLEKMGWKKGSALGLMEDGNPEPIKVTAKSDRRGVGCTVKNADNWIAHQDDFSSILAGLSESNSSMKSSEDTSSTFSLEQTSKNSRSRVQSYQKFAKGKDLSRYETADLQSIFGRRKKKSASNNCDVTSEPQQSKDSDTEQSFGVITVTSSTSIGSYFAQKMAEMKERLARGGKHSSTATPVDSGSSQVDPVPTQHDATDGVAMRRKKKRHHEVEVDCDVKVAGDAEVVCESAVEDVVLVKESKKKRRHRNEEELEVTNQEEESVEEEPKKKRKKNKKQKQDSEEPHSGSVHCDDVSSTVDVDLQTDPVCCRDSCDVEESAPDRKKSKKSKKSRKCADEPVVEQPSVDEVDLHVSKKKKKSKDRR